jgi:hypothetical protein
MSRSEGCIKEDLKTANYMIITMLFAMLLVGILFVLSPVNIISIVIIVYMTVGGTLVIVKALLWKENIKRELKEEGAKGVCLS